MKKIISILLLVLTLAVTSTTPALAMLEKDPGVVVTDTDAVNRRLYTQFEDISQYIEFSRVWLSLCPKMINLQPNQRDQYERSLKKEQRQLAAKICTNDNHMAIKKFLKYLLAINIYGSIDIKNSDYNLPGAGTKSSGSRSVGDYLQTITFFNKGVSQYVSESNPDIEDIFRVIARVKEVDSAIDKIMNSCQSTTRDGFKDCNNLLNIDDITNNQNIFSWQSRNQTYLQQMHFNALTNAKVVEEISNDLVKFDGITDEFRQQQLIPVLDFSQNNQLDLPEITNLDSEAYPDPAPRGSFGRFLIGLLKIGTNIADLTYQIVAKWFLNIKIDLFNSDASLNVWSNFRNITNVGFVLVFLMIVFSQLTGRGLSNYQVKAMLPKLLIAIILVNLSYIITQIIIDLSNIIGKNIYQLLVNPDSINGNFQTFYDLYANKKGSIADVLGIILMILSSLFVILSTILNILLLTVRDAVIVVLIVISPFAMLSAMLPHLNGLFKQWWRMLINMTSISPLISALIGGSILIDFVVSDAGSDAGFIAFLSAKLAMCSALIACPFIVIKAMKKVDSLITVGDGSLIDRLPTLIKSNDPLAAGQRSHGWFNKTALGKNLANQRQFKRNQKRGMREGSFWALNAAQARQQSGRQINTATADFSRNQAAEMIDTFYNYYKNDIKSDTLKLYQTKLANYGTNKEMMLALALSYAKDASNQGNVDVNFILKALYNAQNRGATQAELNQTFEAVLKEFKQRSDFRSIGLLKANFEHQQNTHGQFDSKALIRADSIATTPQDQSFHDAIYKHTQQSLNELQIGNKNSEQIVNLFNNVNIKRGSVASKVFINHLEQNKSARDTLFNNYHLISSEAQQELGADMELMAKLRDLTLASKSATSTASALSASSTSSIPYPVASPTPSVPSSPPPVRPAETTEDNIEPAKDKKSKKYQPIFTEPVTGSLSEPTSDPELSSSLEPELSSNPDNSPVSNAAINRQIYKAVTQVSSKLAHDDIEALKQQILNSIKRSNGL